MPQEGRSRRSLGYRSFITCEDPRGVVEYGTIKKPTKTPTQKEENGKKLESDRRKPKNLGLYSKEMETKGFEDGHSRSPTSFHLLEVSRGAQKLNHVINSWPTLHSRNNSRELAQDLLEGALDLGESLALFSRFQKSPNYMLESTKKPQKHKVEKGLFEDGDDDLNVKEMEFVEDMKKVIRDGIGRKHVLKNDFLNEEFCGGRMLDTFDAPTSSSQTSIAASKKRNEKAKRPNLIAKLMGLEDAPLRSLPYTPRKHMGKGEKILKQKNSAFDLGGRKHEHDSQQFNSKERWDDNDINVHDRPPIAILRPLKFLCIDLEEPIVPKSRGDVCEETFLGMRIRTNPLAKTHECQTLNFSKEVKEDVKAKEKTSPLGKSKSHKKQFVERYSEEFQKLSDSRRKAEMKGAKKNKEQRSYFHSQDGRQGTKKNKEKVAKTPPVTDDNQRYKAVTEDASQIEITDYVDDEHSSLSETPLLFNNHRNSETALMKTNEEGNVCCDHLADGNESQSFINHVKEKLFDLKTNPDSDLLLGTANELVSLHSSRCIRSAFLPFPWTILHKTSSITRCISMDQLLGEVCDEIKLLRSHRTAEDDNHSIDSSILLLVKDDLRSNGILGGMWDMGWMSTGSADEFQDIIKRVEELVLDGLMQEILV